ncbi:hypothetical protein EDD86DRAFT_202626 [Gorgonomyces haynaldii]|nr:hypothetical protein EDD86DRAFT_202626 [Gorgonomyces haynaldii]
MKRVKTVLEEEEYLDAMSQIIKRDFYPQLDHQPIDMHLDEFHDKFTSQDNVSFQQLLQKTNTERKQRFPNKQRNALMYNPPHLIQDAKQTKDKKLSYEATRTILDTESREIHKKPEKVWDLVPQTPVLEPERDMTPLMTYGVIQGTPREIQEGFTIQEPSKREKLSNRLANQRQRKRSGIEKTPLHRLLSPRGDLQLKQSYTPQRKSGWTPTPQHK